MAGASRFRRPAYRVAAGAPGLSWPAVLSRPGKPRKGVTMQHLDEIWFEHAGAKLFAVASGSGRPIVLLHGGLATHLACRVFAASLAERFRLITPDLRASGR